MQIVGALPPCEGILFGRLTYNLFSSESSQLRQQNFPLAMGFLALAGASFLANMGMGCGFSVSGFRLTRRLRVLVFEKVRSMNLHTGLCFRGLALFSSNSQVVSSLFQIVRHSMGWFDFPENSTGELTEHLEEDAEAVSSVTGWMLGQQIQVASSLTTGLIIALYFSWQIGLIAMACIPFIVGAGMLQSWCTKPRVIEQRGGISAATILERGLNDISLIKAFNMQEKVSDQYSEALKPDAAYKAKAGLYSGLAFGFSQFATFSTFALLFYAGIMLMVNQKVAFPNFFTSLLAVMVSVPLSVATINKF